MKETDHNLNQLVDDALREMPLLSTPRGIYPEIMKRITSPTETPAWRFSWIDFSLSAVLALITGFFLDLIQGITRSPYWYAKARVELLLLWQDLKLFFLQNYTGVLAGALSLLTVLSLLVILGEVYRRQLSSTRRIPV